MVPGYSQGTIFKIRASYYRITLFNVTRLFQNDDLTTLETGYSDNVRREITIQAQKSIYLLIV